MSSRLPEVLRFRGAALRPFLILAVFAIAFALLPQYASGEVGTANITDVFTSFAGIGLVSLALGLTMIIGEYDLSVSSTYLLGGMLAVKTGGSAPALGAAIAVAAGLLVGFVQGWVIAKLRMSSIPVTLGGFISLLGLVYVLSNSKSINYKDIKFTLKLNEPIATVFTERSLIAIGIFLVIAAVFAFTWLGRDVRAIGSDRKAARASGVRVDRIVIGTFMASASISAFSGALLAYSLAYATPNRTVAPLVFATTAALLGGVSLSGGRGNPLGIGCGVLCLALLNEALAVTGSAAYVTYLVTGGLLLVVVIVDAPHLLRWWRTTKAAENLRLGFSGSAAAPAGAGGER
ncbi:MAG TPA: ABC transporter permease [Solirubrobacterales bacterium]|nr:ABC transporter permease [Solirubrobacterales bacterium]